MEKQTQKLSCMQLLERAGDVGAVHGDPEAGKDDLDGGEPVEHAVAGAVHGLLPVVDRVDEGRQRGGQDVDIHRGPLVYGNRFKNLRGSAAVRVVLEAPAGALALHHLFARRGGGPVGDDAADGGEVLDERWRARCG